MAQKPQPQSTFSPQQMAELDTSLAQVHPQAGQDDAMVNEQLDMLVTGRGPADWQTGLKESLVSGTFASEAAISDATRQRIQRLASSIGAEGQAAVSAMVPGTRNSQKTLSEVSDSLLNAPFGSSF